MQHQCNEYHYFNLENACVLNSIHLKIKVKLKVDFSSQKVTRQKCFVVTFIGRYHR